MKGWYQNLSSIRYAMNLNRCDWRNFCWQQGMNRVWVVNGTNLVYYTNIGYFPSKFPVVDKYNDDNDVCDDSYTSYYKYYNFHCIVIFWIIFLGGGVGEIGNIFIFLIHAGKLFLLFHPEGRRSESSYLPFTMIVKWGNT